MPDRFPYPPKPRNADGDLRAVGVEVECGGVDAEDVAHALQEALGGELSQDDAIWHLTGSDLGALQIFLDTKYKNTLSQSDLVRSLAEVLIPVEIVTTPIPLDRLGRLDALESALRDLGAKGSRSAPQYGFGVHLNVEVRGTDVDGWWPELRAYALIEPALRDQDAPDASRRMLPFIQPYADSLQLALLGDKPADTEAATRHYLQHAASRNHALDMLPLLAHLHPDAVKAAVDGKAAGSARPAFHYRLPETRLDEDAWSLAYEWQRWCAIEEIAQDPDLMERIAGVWRSENNTRARRAALTNLIQDRIPDPFA